MASGSDARAQRGRWLRRGLVVAVSVGVALLPFELFARVYAAPPEYVAGMRFDARLGNLTSPGLRLATSDERGPYEYRTNARGFRGDELPPTDADGAVERLLFVGDSFVNAWGVRGEETMSARVASGRSEPGREVRAFNICSNDIGTGQELLLWREHGRDLEPELVVLVMFPGNDVANNAIELAGRSEWSPSDYVRPYLVADPAGEWEARYAHPWRALLRRNLTSFAWLEHRLVSWGQRRSVDWLAPFAEATPPRERVEAGHAPFEYAELFCTHEEDRDWDRAWETTERLIESFRDEVEATGSRFLLVVIPVRFQVQWDGMLESRELDSWLRAGVLMSERLDWNLPERRLEGFCRRSGIEAVFLLEPLRREAARSPGRVYLDDGHLTGLGHEVAAAEILARLAAGGAAAAPAEFSEPTRWLGPASEAPSMLDLRSERGPIACLAAGWTEWHPDWGGAGAGRGAMVPVCEVMVPARAGDLVLRGSLPEGVALPHPLRLGITNVVSEEFELTETGPFELRLPEPIPAAFLPPHYQGYAPVAIHGEASWSLTQGDTRAISVIVHEVGFE